MTVGRLLALPCLAALLLLSSCVSFSFPGALSETGRTLPAGKTRVDVQALVLPGVVPGSLTVSRGFPGGWQASVGYGVHGVGDGASSNGVQQGPEIGLTKQLLDFRNWLYLGASVGSRIDLIPRFGALVYAGLDLGAYPLSWLTAYLQVHGEYLVGGIPGLLVALGTGIDGPVSLKLAAYLTPLPVVSGPASAPNEILFPFGARLSLGVRF